MAWPFGTSPPPPDFDTTITAVPLVSTSISTATQYPLMGAATNPTSGSINLTVTDTAGNPIIPTMEVPANLRVPLEFAFEPVAGMKWYASAAGLYAHIWGY